MKKNDSMKAGRSGQKPLPQEKKILIVQLLLKCGLFLQREMHQVCQRFGLSLHQFSVLNEIVWHGPISQKELVERLFFEKSNVSKIVRILLGKKLINVAVAPEDRRITLLLETHQGAALWKDCMQAFNESSAEMMVILSEQEVSKEIELLKKLQKAFQNRQAQKDSTENLHTKTI
jgi:DNA-binding MarR family transcriptional regulator